MNLFTETETEALPSHNTHFYGGILPKITTPIIHMKTESSPFHQHHHHHHNDIVYHQLLSRKAALPPAVKDDSGITFNNHLHPQLPSPKRSTVPHLISINPTSTSATTTSCDFDCVANKCGGNLGFFPGDLNLQILQQQQLQLDRLISHHMEKMKMEIEEKKKQQLREIMATVEESIATKLRQKEHELSKIGGINWSLQEKIKSLYLENQIWRDLAHTNEETANTLRSNLQQVLQQMNNTNVEPTAANDTVSCCGSCSGDGGGYEEGDSQEWVKKRKVGKDGGENNNNTSSVPLDGNNNSGWIYRGKNVSGVKNVENGRLLCRKCGEAESSVLILPCRHLCVCTVCGPTVNSCPVCDTVKNASVHVNLS